MSEEFIRITDYELEEPLTVETIAETTGARLSLVVRLIEAGILEPVNEKTAPGEPFLLPRRAVLQLRKMQRLRRDLGVNFVGASVILDLLRQMEEMKREIGRMQIRSGQLKQKYVKGRISENVFFKPTGGL